MRDSNLKYTYLKNKMKLYFVTSNATKFAELTYIIKLLAADIELVQIEAELEEIQGDCDEIARHKCATACRLPDIKYPFIIEDTSLCIDAIGGLPGPYIKTWVQRRQHLNLHKMLNFTHNNLAVGRSIIAYMDELGAPIITFIGSLIGNIEAPRGARNSGWDAIFRPNGYEKTLDEMGDERFKLLPRCDAMRKLMEVL